MFGLFRKRKKEPAGNSQNNGTPTNLPKGSETVLVAEFATGARTEVVRILRELGYRVLEAATGEEALRIVQEARSGNVDIFLTNMVMPDMSGRQLAHCLAKCSLTKVIYCSGCTEKVALQNGAIDHTMPYLQKPIAPDALAYKIREVLTLGKSTTKNAEN